MKRSALVAAALLAWSAPSPAAEVRVDGQWLLASCEHVEKDEAQRPGALKR